MIIIKTKYMEEFEDIAQAENRLFAAISKLHPFIPIDMPEYLELYLSMHDLKEKVSKLTNKVNQKIT